MSDFTSTVRSQIETYVEPHLRQRLGEAQALRSLSVDGAAAHAAIELGFPTLGYAHQLQSALQQHLDAAGITVQLSIELSSRIVAHAVQRSLRPLPGVKNIVPIASGKGGVGKSTVSVNLALALSAAGARVGILDADIYGPSVPMMLGLTGQRPLSPDGKHLRPLEAFGLQVMSIGFLVDTGQAVIWRGPMVTQALTQLALDTQWQDLDYLLVDMPPGTGDIQLTLVQKIPIAGAVIVTTPQDIALADAARGLAMFEKVAVPVLGIIENMSLHTCSHCGHVEHIFGAGGGARMAAQTGVQLLGELPLDQRIGSEVDRGQPSVVAEPGSARAEAFISAARHAAGALARRPPDRSGLMPKIVVEKI